MGRARAAVTAGDEVATGRQRTGDAPKICTVCNRDPRVVPKDFKVTDSRGRSRPGTLAEWAAKVRVVASDLCARDYQRRRRGSVVLEADARRGATERWTIRLLPDEDKKVSTAVKASGKSESAWGAEALVEKAERDLPSGGKTK